MKLKSALIAVALSSFVFQTSQASSLVDFTPGNYTLQEDWTTFQTVTPSAAGLTVNGSAFGESVAVAFAEISFSISTPITLTGTLNSPTYGSQFSVYLFDESYENFHIYTGEFQLAEGRSTLTLTYLSSTASFEKIGLFMFTGEGPGEPLDYTFEKLEAVPEPSVYALTFLAAGGAYLLRRRRAMNR